MATQNSLSDGEEEVKTSEIKMYNHKKQLEYFKMQMDEKIAELIKKQIEAKTAQVLWLCGCWPHVSGFPYHNCSIRE